MSANDAEEVLPRELLVEFVIPHLYKLYWDARTEVMDDLEAAVRHIRLICGVSARTCTWFPTFYWRGDEMLAPVLCDTTDWIGERYYSGFSRESLHVSLGLPRRKDSHSIMWLARRPGPSSPGHHNGAKVIADRVHAVLPRLSLLVLSPGYHVTYGGNDGGGGTDAVPLDEDAEDIPWDRLSSPLVILRDIRVDTTTSKMMSSIERDDAHKKEWFILNVGV